MALSEKVTKAIVAYGAAERKTERALYLPPTLFRAAEKDLCVARAALIQAIESEIAKGGRS